MVRLQNTDEETGGGGAGLEGGGAPGVYGSVPYIWLLIYAKKLIRNVNKMKKEEN